MKVYCVVDTYRNGRFFSFVDFDSDTDFIEYLYRNHIGHFSEIINALYRSDDPSYDCGVNYYSYSPTASQSFNIRYEIKFSRRYDYLLPFEEEEKCF